MKAWAEFYPHVLPDVLGCPNPVMERALCDAAREFLLASKAWQETEEFTADGTENRFDFDLPSQTELIQVVRGSVANRELKIYGVNKLPPDHAERSACLHGLYHASEDEYMLFPTPSAGQVVSLTIAVRPLSTGFGVGDDVFKKHVEAIAAGAKARLLKKPRQPWTDIESAGIFQAEFTAGMHTAANRDFIHTSPAQRRVKHWG